MKNNGKFFAICAIGAIVYMIAKTEVKRTKAFNEHANDKLKDRNFKEEAEKLTVKNDDFDAENKVLTGEVFDYYISRMDKAKEVASIKMFDDAFDNLEKLEHMILTGTKDEINATFTLEKSRIAEKKREEIEEARRKAEKNNYEMIADAIKSFSSDFRVNTKFNNPNIRFTF